MEGWSGEESIFGGLQQLENSHASLFLFHLRTPIHPNSMTGAEMWFCQHFWTFSLCPQSNAASSENQERIYKKDSKCESISAYAPGDSVSGGEEKEWKQFARLIKRCGLHLEWIFFQI